jgi:hypothetical protein
MSDSIGSCTQGALCGYAATRPWAAEYNGLAVERWDLVPAVLRFEKENLSCHVVIEEDLPVKDR